MIARGPYPQAVQKWDELLLDGRRVVAVGGSDAHAMHASLGPIRRTVFPYEFHFSAINTHLLLPEPLSGEAEKDRRLILEALSAGHAFIGYDLPAPTRGFRFTAQGKEASGIMGDEMRAGGGVTLQARLPALAAEIRLIRDGRCLRTWKQAQACAHITTEPGVYRLEVYRHYLGRLRAWIISNPVYLR